MPVRDSTRVGVGVCPDLHHARMEEIKQALNDGLLLPDDYLLAEQTTDYLGPDMLSLQSDFPDADAAAIASPGTIAATAPAQACLTARTERGRSILKPTTLVLRPSSGEAIVALAESDSPATKRASMPWECVWKRQPRPCGSPAPWAARSGENPGDGDLGRDRQGAAAPTEE